jgi:hypothetical protein
MIVKINKNRDNHSLGFFILSYVLKFKLRVLSVTKKIKKVYKSCYIRYSYKNLIRQNYRCILKTRSIYIDDVKSFKVKKILKYMIFP